MQVDEGGLPVAYQSVSLDQELFIKSIYTIHYYEYQNDFHFDGERHDFWEFQCVDTGAAEVVTDNDCHTLSRGQVIFHRPNEFHTLKATGKTAPSIIVISFSCDSPCMEFFENKILTFSETERSILGRIIAEARNCFDTPLDDPYLEQMIKKPEISFGSQQLLTLYLEELLIHMIRRYTIAHYSASAGIYDPCQTTSDTCRKIIHYLEQHVRETLTIQDISRNNMIGRSQLQKLFREEYQCGVIEFFSRMKIDFAKQLIRENEMNFTQISDFLSYSSIHYFSRQFKKLSGMTPTEYATSIKALSERPQRQN